MSKKRQSKGASPASLAPRLPCVRVDLIHPQAREVFIAGTFNDWHPSATPMISLGGGRWAKELTLAPGRYEYRFVVDGEWMEDPSAKETVPNPFGGSNAVLIVSQINEE